MNSLPMAPADCSLDEPDLRAQLARYRGVGKGAAILEQSRQRLVIRVGAATSDVVVDELVAVERRCCPIFDLGWEPHERRLSISVPGPEHESALDAIATALELSDAADIRKASA
jgi:hypothetical protein